MNMTMNYFDIHAHILPGVDDGSQSMEETVRMLKIASEQGIRTIIATPHYVAGGKNTAAAELELVRERVQEEAVKLNKDFRILLGNELYYSESIVNALKSQEARTLAGSRYVLVEFPVGDSYNRIFKGMGDLIRAGYAPILAHVERYQCLGKKLERIDELIKLGCYIQMNSSSLIGGIFNSEANWNRKLLNQGLVHFIASDCHDDEVRTPVMESLVKTLFKKCDEGIVNEILLNPQKVLENTYI